MKDTDIQIGKAYDIKVGKNLVAVRIMRLAEKEGWEGVSLKNNNPVIIRSAERIVGLHNPKTATLPPVSTKPQEPSNKPVGKQKPTERKLGGLSAAAQVLAEAGGPMTCKAIVKAMLEKGLWNSDGNTPVSTIYSSIIREIKAKGDSSRFRKIGKGLFEIAR
jgi:hypothetical protein